MQTGLFLKLPESSQAKSQESRQAMAAPFPTGPSNDTDGESGRAIPYIHLLLFKGVCNKWGFNKKGSMGTTEL